MFASFTLAALVALAPGQADNLKLSNARNTHGQLGPVRADSKMLPGDILYISFDIEGLTIAEDGRAQYSTQLEVFDKADKSVFKKDPYETVDFIPLGGNRRPAQAFITIGDDQPAGEYTAKITVTEKATKASKTLDRKFEVLPANFGIVNVYTSIDVSGSTPAPTTGVVGQSVFIFYSAVGFKRDDKKQPSLHFEMTPLDDQGKPTLGKPIVHDVTALDEKTPHYPLRFSLPMSRPGKFSVRLSCTDKLSGKTATFDLPVVILSNDK